jgi:hypothetical protein
MGNHFYRGDSFTIITTKQAISMSDWNFNNVSGHVESFAGKLPICLTLFQSGDYRSGFFDGSFWQMLKFNGICFKQFLPGLSFALPLLESLLLFGFSISTAVTILAKPSMSTDKPLTMLATAMTHGVTTQASAC